MYSYTSKYNCIAPRGQIRHFLEILPESLSHPAPNDSETNYTDTESPNWSTRYYRTLLLQ